MVIAQTSASSLFVILFVFMDFIRTVYKYASHTCTFLHNPSRMLSLHEPVQGQLLSNRCNIIGPMMAFSYFHYLKTAAIHEFSEFRRRINTYERSNGIKLHKHIFIMIPKSCTFRNFKSLKLARNLDPLKLDSAGTRNREVHQAVLKATDQKYGKERPYFLLDIPLCLLTLNKLQSDADLTLEEKQQIVAEFIWVLSRLLHEDITCKRFCRILTYNDLLNDVTITAESFIDLEKNATFLAEHTLDSPRWTFTSSNLGFGFALQYYFNYLCRVLKDLPDRMDLWEKENRGCVIYRKMIVCVPYSFSPLPLLTYVSDDEDLDEDLPLPLGDHTEDMCFIENYTFQQSVYKLLTDTAIRYFTAVCPSGDHIYEMIQDFRWPKSVLSDARVEFVATLRRLLTEGRPKYSELCEVVAYDDDEINGEKISSLVHNLVST